MDFAKIWLKLNGRTYSSTELAAGRFPGSGSAFEQATLNFCNQWLCGIDTFRLKTSGSTGSAKSIFIQRSQMETSARLTQKALNLQQGLNALLCLDVNFIAGKMMLVRSFITGMNILAVDPIANPFQEVKNEKIDFAALVPYQLQAILKSASAKEKLNEISTVIIGGAPLDSDTIDQLQQLKCSVYATYGMTETISHVALQKLNGAERLDYFEALPGIQFELDDRECLVIDASLLGLERIKTNDIVKLLSATTFQWLGRWDNIINSGGIKVLPERIEREVEKQSFGVNLTNRFFIAGLPDQQFGSKVVLLIEGSFNKKNELLSLLTKRLSKFEMPKEIHVMEQFIETETKKINRPATLQLLLNSQN